MTPLLYLGSSSVDSYYLCIVSPDSLFVLLIPSYILNDCLFTTVNVKKKKKKIVGACTRFWFLSDTWY